MAMSYAKEFGSPMMDINTTPLIDVMLVLLIMFVITIPVATHSVDVDLPREIQPPPTDIVKPVVNRLTVTNGGEIFWNEAKITRGQLPALLKRTRAMPVEPELQFKPERDAPYDLAARIVDVIKASKVTKFGFVDNERYANFGKD